MKCNHSSRCCVGCKGPASRWKPHVGKGRGEGCRVQNCQLFAVEYWASIHLTSDKGRICLHQGVRINKIHDSLSSG